MRSTIFTLPLAAALITAHLPSSAFAQEADSSSTATTRSRGSSSSTDAPAAHPTSSSSSHHPSASKSNASHNETDKATDIAPLAPLSIPTFNQCEPAVINATASVNPNLNAHDLSVQVAYPNGTEYFVETVKGSGKKAVPVPFVWVWTAVDLQEGTQFLLSVNQSGTSRKSSKDQTPKQLVLLAPTPYTVGPSPTNQTSCLQEAADTNHKGRRHREIQRGQNEVRIIAAVIGSFVFILLLLIGLMAYRRRREAKRSATSGNVDYDDDIDDFSGSGAARLTGAGAPWGNSEMTSSAQNGSGAGVASQQPQRRNMERAPGWKYMSRVVGGQLESDDPPANSSSANLYHHDAAGADEYGYGGVRRGPGANGQGSQNNNPFGNHHQAFGDDDDTAYLGGTGAANSASAPDQASSSPMIPLNRIAGAEMERTGLRGDSNHHASAIDDSLPSYRESAAGRRRSGKKGRLGADGRIQGGVVVRARPPQYQDEWRAKQAAAASSAEGSPYAYEQVAQQQDCEGTQLVYRS